jgi:transcriptional regulator with XRE-family HTH domain
MASTLRAQFVALITSALEESGMTQAELARLTGHTPKHINRVLQGHNGASLEVLEYWAFVLGRHWTVALKKGRG